MDRNTAIRRSQLKPIQYDDLDATNVAVDNYIPSYDEATGKFTWVANTAGGVPGGSDTHVQYNDAGAFGGESTFTWNKTYDRLTVNGKILTRGIWDADMDTGVQVSSGWIDEDKIRFNTAGYERWQIDASGNFIPGADNSYDIGTSVLGIKDLYIIGNLSDGTNTATILNIKDAVDKKHIQNTDTDLDATFEATFVKKVDTVNVLSDITSPGADIEDAVTKRHTSGSETLGGDLTGTVANALINVDDFTIKKVSNTLKIADRIEQNIMFNAFRIAVNGSLTQFNMVDGITDEFEDESGVDTTNSTNESYDSTNDLYQPSTEGTGIDSYTKLMLHCNGADGSISHPITFVGNSQIDTAQYKLGVSSGLFNGTTDYLTIPDHVDWDFWDTDFTIDFWLRFNDKTGYQYFFQHEQDGTNYLEFYKNDTDVLIMRAVLGGVSKGQYSTTSAPTINDATWYHVEFAKSGSTAYIFFDGVSQTLTTTVAFDTLGALSGLVRIGVNNNGGSPLQYFNGWLDEFRVSKGIARNSSSFTPETFEYESDQYTCLLLHFNGVDTATVTNDESGGEVSDSDHTVTYNGTAQIDTAQYKFNTGSIEFNGTTDYLTIPDHVDWDIFSQTDFTIDFWVKMDIHSGTEYFICQYEDASNYWSILHSDTNGLRFNLISDIVSITTSFGGEITDTSWYHIAVCKVGNDYGVYKDGTQVGYTNDSDTDTLAGILYIGSMRTDAGFFDGHIEELRINHNNAFSASPNVGLTDTITVSTNEYITGAGITYNMTLIANSVTAEAIPSDAKIVIFEEDVDAVTINTDLKAYISRDGGSTWAQVTLSDEGDYDTTKRILSGTVDLTQSGIGSGTSMEWKIETLNNKDLKLHGVGELWD